MAEDISTINLKVLSPSTEVEGGVSFPDLPATTTVQELRSRIQDAVPSKPATERMRLIYRGRVVANDADTLGHVFGADNIRDSKEQSLHLVLRELPSTGPSASSPAPRSATAPPNPFRPAQAPIPASPPLHTNPFRTLPQPRPSSQPQAPPPHQHQHHHHHHPHVHLQHVPGPPNPFQMPLQTALQQHLAHTQQHLAQAMGNANANVQAHNTQAQNGGEGTPTPENGPQPAPMGLPPLPGFGPPSFPPNAGRTVRQEGIGPNGERWSVTYSSANLPAQAQHPMLPPGFPHPPAFGLPLRPGGSPAPTEAIDRLLPRMRHILQSARQEMENVRTLLQASGQQAAQPAPLSSANPPTWRLERIRQHLQIMDQNLNLVERGLGVIAADVSMTDNTDVIALRQSAIQLRGQLVSLNNSISQQNIAASAPLSAEDAASILLSGASTTAPTPSISTQPETHATLQTLPPDVPEELFILSSPQGPVGILFDQRGTYMTAPFVPTLPFQTFTNQFAQNRQLMAGIGQQIAQGSHHMHTQLANIQPTPTQPPAATGQPQNQDQPGSQGAEQGQVQDQNQAQAQAQAPAQNANANAPPNAQADNDRVGNIFGHVWLVFKLACFVYFFSGTGWYKSILLGIIAGCVYLAQLGLFEEQFNLIRRHFEAVLPVGAMAERAAQPIQRRNTTPEEAARRLLQQQRQGGWIRETVRTVERAGAIFVASLWPGIGERMVHAQEERARLERVVEEEERTEEERKRREEAEQQAEEKEKKDEEVAEEHVGDEAGESAKGKERADEEVAISAS